MKPCVVYFSRTGNTKRFAEAIAEATNAPMLLIAEVKAADLDACDMLILGTPVEGASPAKETWAFAQQLPQTQGKKAIFFTTYRMFGNQRTMNKMQKLLSEKGYQTMLKITKKVKKPEDLSNLSEQLSEVKKTL